MSEIRHYIHPETIWAHWQTYGGYCISVWTRLPPSSSLSHSLTHGGPLVSLLPHNLPSSLSSPSPAPSEQVQAREGSRAEPAAPTLDKNTGGAAWPCAAGRAHGRATAWSQPRCRWASTWESDSVERAVLPPAERAGGRPRQAATPPLAEHAGRHPRHAAAGRARGQASTMSQPRRRWRARGRSTKGGARRGARPGEGAPASRIGAGGRWSCVLCA